MRAGARPVVWGAGRAAAIDCAPMKITLKLFATLTDYLPAQSKYSNVVELDVPDATTVGQVIEQQRLPEKWVHLVLVNGHYVAPAERADKVLQEQDVLAIWPPIAGG